MPYLDVDVGAVADEQLQAERPVARGCREVQRREALLVHLVDVGPRVDELADDHVLPVVAGHMQRRVAVCVRLVDLEQGDEEGLEGSPEVTLLLGGWRGGGTHVHPQVQQELDHADHAAGRGRMQRGVRLLVLAGHLGSVIHQEFHHLYVA